MTNDARKERDVSEVGDSTGESEVKGERKYVDYLFLRHHVSLVTIIINIATSGRASEVNFCDYTGECA